jgi:FKBP-type peptidyl-prolyl cis-trans isomerase SlyD
MEKEVDKQQKPDAVADDVVVSIDYTLTVDGAIIDSSDEEGPLEFLQGHGNIIPGLEKAMYGMKTGETKHVVVVPDSGYGEYDPEAVMLVPRSEFPKEIPLKPGVELEVTDQEGDTQYARIVSLTKDEVKLDFNHPLAGKTLDFQVSVTELRHPTGEELDHGHVHAAHHHHHDEEEELAIELDEDDFDEDDFDEDEDEEEYDEDDELMYVDDDDDYFDDDDDYFDEDEDD